MDPKENSGRLLEEDLAKLYGLDEVEEEQDQGDEECSGSDSQ